MIKRKSCYQVFADGGARGNPGPAAIGFVVKDSDGHEVKTGQKFIGRSTNNVAEYSAVISALEWLKKYLAGQDKQKNDHHVDVYLDSQLVVNQLNGLYKIKNASLRDLAVKVRQVERKVNASIVYHHIPRDKNKRADQLLNDCLDKQIKFLSR